MKKISFGRYVLLALVCMFFICAGTYNYCVIKFGNEAYDYFNFAMLNFFATLTYYSFIGILIASTVVIIVEAYKNVNEKFYQLAKERFTTDYEEK